nr:MAG TPA: Protein of unknown function (DUF1351) [Caudoviricetes sp.]
MELKINEVALPAPITFNYEELRAELLSKVSVYETMVYTEDQVKEAKADRAALNRLKKALNDERIRQEKDYMQPFNTFKAQVGELVKIIDKSVSVVDKQVKEFEEQQKAEKLKAIEEYWHSVLADNKVLEAVSFRQILDDKWLNASVSMKSIQGAIDGKLEQMVKDLAVIADLPSYSFEARECYMDTLDLAKAVSEAHRLQEQAEKRAAWEAEQQERKEEAAAAQIKPTQVTTNINDPDDIENCPARQWIGFQALLSADEARALGAWLRGNGIKYKAI